MKIKLNPKVDAYLVEGCGRCPLGGTPQCKVNKWPEVLAKLRSIILECGLIEELKWGVPCYTFQESNVLILSALKDYSALGFFKGALLKDPQRVLSKPGAHSQAVRQFRFSDVLEIAQLEGVLKSYIYEAIEVERAGLKVKLKKNPEPLPEELEIRLNEDPALKAAFQALTPGRQRGYILYFSQPKQSKTRSARVEKYVEKIFSGKGFHDR